MDPAEGVVGRIVDSARRPLAEVAIAIDDERAGRTTSDPTGRFELRLSDVPGGGPLRLVVGGRSHARRLLEVQVAVSRRDVLLVRDQLLRVELP